MKRPSFPPISYDEWRRRVVSDLGERGFEQALISPAEGLRTEALCTAMHPERPPAQTPPTRSREPSTNPLSWTVCQQYDQSDPQELNHHLRSDLEGGVEGLWLRLDRTGRLGEDPMTSSSVGSGGAAVYRITDWAETVDGIRPDWKALLMDAGGCFLPAAAMIVDWMQWSDLDLETRTLLFGADPLGTLARDGKLPASLDELQADMAVLIRQSRGLPSGARALAVSTQAYREAGAEIDQELAICLATIAEYLRWMERHGLSPEETAAELALTTSTGPQIFLEIAKLRALRILWRHLTHACGVPTDRSPWIHASVLRRSLPAREPSNNLLRITTAGLAAALGGADSVETPAYDWFSGDGGSERGRRLARNTQLVLALEAQLGRVSDPGAGSYFLETVTQQLVIRAWTLFQEIERQGGLWASLDSGKLQEAVDKRWQERREAVKQGQIGLTGVNRYQDPDTGFQHASESPNPAVRDRIRRRFAERQKDHELRSTSSPSEPGARWQWCLKSALEERSIAEMKAALYPGNSATVVSAFAPRRDSEPCETEGVGS